ncbi:MAG: ATP-dependent Clp protease ATP-binding subunit, partial [Acidobacteriaceae bacterium]|nr:ATP-dependent Clp protease ATP-binding subunit [Acidobacteriaceae bacterium]
MGQAGLKLDMTRTGWEAEALERNLRRRVVGQEDAIRCIAECYQMFLTGLRSPGRPVGNFLFLGPTGCGKTRVVEAVAESLFGSARAVLKIDCAEFQHSHEIAKLIGSPPGYLGHRETHAALSQEVLDQFHTAKLKMSLVLFDEIEKASDSLWNLLLGILDKGILTLGDNRKVDFSSAMIFMTSNLGAAEMSTLIRPKVGFGSFAERPDERLVRRLRTVGEEAARRKFPPEFFNRLDKIVAFQALGEAELRSVLDLELSLVQERLLAAAGGRPLVLTLSDAAKDLL